MDNPETPQKTDITLPNNTLAIVSLVTGIISLLLPYAGSLAAIISGHIAKKEIKESATPQGGDGMATAGLILGYATLVLPCCIIAVLLALGPEIGNTFEEIESELGYFVICNLV